MSEAKRDYLAVVINAYGGGSYARGPDREFQIKRVAKMYKADFSHLFKIGKKGSPLVVNVLDVTDFDEVTWDDRGFWAGKEAFPKDKLEVVTHTY